MALYLKTITNSLFNLVVQVLFEALELMKFKVGKCQLPTDDQVIPYFENY